MILLNVQLNRWLAFLRYNWDKIRNIHKKIVNLIATNIVRIALYYKSPLVRMENLKRAVQKSKSEVESYISKWQVHMFFALIYKTVEQKCRQYGIYFQLVPALYTSWICNIYDALDVTKRNGESGNIIHRGRLFECRNKKAIMEEFIASILMSMAKPIAVLENIITEIQEELNIIPSQ